MTGDWTLAAEIEQRGGDLRPAALVMAPATLGAARLSKHSFSRSMLRTASSRGWSGRRVAFDMDTRGRGEAVYEMQLGSETVSFVAFTTVVDEDRHTDRVIGEEWEISGALVTGPVDAAEIDRLRRTVPLQERARFDPDVMVLTRGNRSVRFFQALVERLAIGRQPEPTAVADAGYLMRSTAFYGNGKFGLRSFDAYGTEHPLAVPYRAQMLCAWLYRELSYDVVEHCARAVGGPDAVQFDADWRRYFGLGNATGLGLVPYALKHPRVLHAWAAVRELALADVRAATATAERRQRLAWWLDRAERHMAVGSAADTAPFLSPRHVARFVARIRSAFEAINGDHAFDHLYRWAEAQHPECRELLVSLLIELHETDDALIDQLLVVNEEEAATAPTTAGQALELLSHRFDWLDSLDLESTDSDHFWWVLSDNNEEPRRVARRQLAPEGRDLAIDVALRMSAFRDELRRVLPETPIDTVLTQHPSHRFAARRLAISDRPYGEPRDNACSTSFLPLQLQRFQLAMYGMDNFTPKSTDWLRVTLFQGAPRLSDLDDPDAMSDDWVLPPRPGALP